eukprot:13514120-Heterocapsa_arctica.AAC.1
MSKILVHTGEDEDGRQDTSGCGNSKDAEIRNRSKRRYEDNEDENYPGVSSQKRVKNRAEQIFYEAQAKKKEQQTEADNKRALKL